MVGVDVLDFTAQDTRSLIPQQNRASPFSVLFGVALLISPRSLVWLRFRRPSRINDLPHRSVGIADDDVTGTSRMTVLSPLAFRLPQSVTASRHRLYSSHFEQAITGYPFDSTSTS
jgi:hypothetical protein